MIILLIITIIWLIIIIVVVLTVGAPGQEDVQAQGGHERGAPRDEALLLFMCYLLYVFIVFVLVIVFYC